MKYLLLLFTFVSMSAFAEQVTDIKKVSNIKIYQCKDKDNRIWLSSEECSKNNWAMISSQSYPEKYTKKAK